MKSNYKRLGDIITPVSVKNTDMLTSDLRGVNYQKFFMKSVANTVGVDLSGYKVIKKGQFACNLMHVGRDECLPIALHREEEPIIVSPAYFSFEVKNENEILSEFLFLWFKRKEFDREACFYTDADVRQGLIKSSFYDIQVPVPPIEEQRKIVGEYQAIERRIENNRRLIATLEASAQVIYRNMFVDNIDPENLPDGWSIGVLGDIMKISSGKSLSDKVVSPNKMYQYPVAGASGIIGYSRESNQNERFLTTGRVGTIGVVNRYLTPAWTADNVLVAKSDHYEYAYQVLQGVNYQELIGGGVQNLITQTGLSNVEMQIPPSNRVIEFETCVERITRLSDNLRNENILLYDTHSLLLSKLSKL